MPLFLSFCFIEVSSLPKKKKGVYGRPMNPKDKDKVIGLGKPNEVSKKPMGVWN